MYTIIIKPCFLTAALSPLCWKLQSFKSSSFFASYPHLSLCFDFMSKNSSQAPLDCYVDRLSARGTEPSR